MDIPRITRLATEENKRSQRIVTHQIMKETEEKRSISTGSHYCQTSAIAAGPQDAYHSQRERMGQQIIPPLYRSRLGHKPASQIMDNKLCLPKENYEIKMINKS